MKTTFKKKFSIRLDEEQFNFFRLECWQHDLDEQDQFRKMLRNWITKRRQKMTERQNAERKKRLGVN